jgi:molybdenum cofactor guanylyltransferase
MTEEKNITAVILAGGKSLRMGTDKGLLDFRGGKMIGHVLRNAVSVARHVIIVSSNPAYNETGYAVVRDVYKNCGPLGGVHAGMVNSKTEWILVIGCDLPFVTAEFLSFLVANLPASGALVPLHGDLAEPLCALYHTSLIPEIEKLLVNGELKMQNALKKLDAVFLPVPKEKFDSSVLFQNINSPGDLSAAAGLHITPL